MADINEILGRQINNVKELKKAISDLQNSLIGVDVESEQFKTTSEQLAAAQAELNKVTKAGKEDNDAAADSIRGMEKEYKKLYDTYKLLSDEQRNSDFGKNMAASLDQLGTKINETKQGVSNFTSNIGNYTNSAIAAFKQMGQAIGGLNSPMKMAGGGAQALGKSLKALIANPVGAVIMAIVIAIKGMQEALKKSEDAQRKFNQALEALKPIADFIIQVFEALIEVVSNVIKTVGDFITKLFNLSEATNDAASATKNLKVAQEELNAAYSEMDVYDKNRERKIKDLRDELAVTKDLTKKQEILNDIKKLQGEIDENAYTKAHNALKQATTDLKFYQEDLERAIELEAQDKITADELAEAKIRLAQAQQTYNKALDAENDATWKAGNNTKKLDQEIKSLGKSTKSAAKSTKDLAQAEKELNELINGTDNFFKTNMQNNLDALETLYKKNKKILEDAGKDTTKLTIKYNIERQSLIQKAETESNNRRYAAEKEYQANIRELAKDSQKEQLNIEQDRIEKTKESLKNLSSLITQVEAEVAGTWAEGIFATLEKEGNLSKALDIEQLLEIAEKLGQEVLPEQMERWGGYVREIQNTIEEINKANGFTIVTFDGLRNKIEIFTKALEEVESKKIVQGVVDELKALDDALVTGSLETQKVLIQNVFDSYQEQLKAEEELYKQKRWYAVQYDGDIEELEREHQERLSAIQQEFSESYMSQVRENERAARETAYENELNITDNLLQRKSILEEALNDEKLLGDARIELQQELNDVLTELNERNLALSDLQHERTLQMIDDMTELSDKMGSSLGSIRSSYETLIDSQLKSGKIDEKEANKRKKRLLALQAAETAFSIASITADAAAGIFSVWKGYALETGTVNPQTAAAAGPGAAVALAALNTKSLVSAIAKTTSLAATATAQIMAARNGYVAARNNFEAETGSGAAVAQTPAIISSEPYSYTKVVQDTPKEDEFNNVNLWVSVTDIAEGLKHQAQVTDESSF